MPEFGYYVVQMLDNKVKCVFAATNMFIFAQLIVKQIGGCILSREEYLKLKV